MAPLSTDDAAAFRPSVPARAPAQLPEHSTAAAERFTCLAERCEDSCCRDWAVALDEESLKRMKDAVAQTPAGRERLHRLVVIGRPSPHSGGRAHIQMDEQGACPMLEADSRCGVQAAAGEEALATACSVFPRTSLAVAGRLEVGVSLACPETARLVLLSDEEPRMRPATKPMLARAYVGRRVSDDPSDAYAQHFPAVRDLLLDIFGRRAHSLGTRLVAAASFADRVSPFYFAGTTEFHGARQSFTSRRLHAERTEAAKDSSIAAHGRELEALALTGESTAALVATLLMERQRLPHGPRFAELVRAVFTSVQEEALGHEARAHDSVTPAQLWSVHRRRRAALSARLEGHDSHVFATYCQHFLMREPFTLSSTLLESLYRLALQLASVQFLTLGHPELAAMLSAAPDPVGDREIFDRVVVHAVQTFTKAVGHQVDFLEVASRSAASSGGSGFGRLVVLSKFV